MYIRREAIYNHTTPYDFPFLSNNMLTAMPLDAK